MKKTGKALSLVLSLALVVSSLTATLASATTKSETGTVSWDNDTFYLSNGGSDDALTADILSKVDGTNVSSFKLSDGSDVSSYSLKDVAVSSGSSVAKVSVTKDDDGIVTAALLKLKSSTVKGTVTVSARFVGSVVRGSDSDSTTVYATKSLTFEVLRTGAVYILKSGSTDSKGVWTGDYTGDKPDALGSLAKSVGDSETGAAYTVAAGSGSAFAVWTAHKVSTATTPEDGVYKISSSNSSNVVATTTADAMAFNVTTQYPGASANNYGSNYASVGSYTITAQRYETSGTTTIASGTTYQDKGTATVKVANRVKAYSTNKVISYFGGATYLYSSAISSSSGVTDARNATNTATTAPITATQRQGISNMSGVQVVSGCDIEIAADTTMESGTVGAVDATTGGTYTFTAEGGSVSSVGANYSLGTVKELDVSGASVGSVGYATWHAVAAVDVTGGSVGTVYSKDVDVISSNETTATAGNIVISSDSGTVDVKSEDDYAVKTGTISAKEGSTITLDGTNVTIGQIDANYNNVTLSLEDFQGSIVAPKDSYTEGIDSVSRGLTVNTSESETGDTVATINGDVSLPAVNVNSGTLQFTGALNVGASGINGSGTLIVVPGKLYTDGAISGINLKLNGAFAKGDTAFKAATDIVDADAFTPVGYTLTSTSSSSVDTFKVASTVFAGLQIAGSSTLTQNTSETYTASPYPTGTALPSGYSVEWDLDGNSSSFSYTANGNSVTVKAGSYDTTFSSLNKATLIAKVIDASGDEDTSYPEATYAITMTQSPATKFTTDGFPTTMKAGQNYTVKITSTDGSKAALAFADNFAVITKTSVSGNATFVTFTAAKSGEHGVYVGGSKVAVIKVAGSICDTNAVTKTAGQSYTFKVTSTTNTAPTFAVATVGNVNASKVSGHDYYFTVKANANKGVHGVYVNGASVALYTFA